MAWRVARSLETLREQLNAMAPRRSKTADGGIGDEAHASRDSDHNPWVQLAGIGIVTARDFTHDPDGGLDCHQLAAWLTTRGDPRVKYVIWNRRIWSPGGGWNPYRGRNPHAHHLHLSVKPNPALYDDTTRWLVGAPLSAGRPATTTTAQPPAPPKETFMSALNAAEQRDLYNRVLGFLRQRWYTTSKDGVVTQCSASTPGATPAAALDTLDGNYLVQQIAGLRADVDALAARVKP